MSNVLIFNTEFLNSIEDSSRLGVNSGITLNISALYFRVVILNSMSIVHDYPVPGVRSSDFSVQCVSGYQ